jgi:hypothetical protein
LQLVGVFDLVGHGCGVVVFVVESMRLLSSVFLIDWEVDQ